MLSRLIAITIAAFVFAVGLLPATQVQADVVNYQLEDVWLDPYETHQFESPKQLTGAFSWIYQPGDFENGTGVFSELVAPWYDPGLENLNITVEPSSLDFSHIGNIHDYGFDLNIFLIESLSTSAPSNINLATSKFDIQRGISWKGNFVSGSLSIISIPEPSTLGILGLALATTCCFPSRRRVRNKG